MTKMKLKYTVSTLLLFIVLSVMTSCDTAPKIGADGYKFGEKQYTQNELGVKVITYSTRADFNKELKRRDLLTKDGEIMAFSVLFTEAPNLCVIHMVDPAVEYKPEFVGHEFLHCVYGQWHTNNKSFK
jgi:hypothetical protein